MSCPCVQVLDCIEECSADTEASCAELHGILLQPHFIVSCLWFVVVSFGDLCFYVCFIFEQPTKLG